MSSTLRFYKSYEIVHAYVQVAGDAITGTGAATNKVSASSHGLTEGQLVVVTAVTTFSVITVGTRYFVKRTDANNFQFASTVGGSALAIGDSGSVTVVPLITYELDWANKITPTADRATYTWQGSSQKKEIESLIGIKLAIDLDCIPAEAHQTIFDKSAITGALPNGMTTSSALAIGGGNDRSGRACGLLLVGNALKSAAEAVVNFSLWYPNGTLTLTAPPGLQTGSVGDKLQYQFAASKTAVDVAGGTISGMATDGDFFILAESD